MKEGASGRGALLRLLLIAQACAHVSAFHALQFLPRCVRSAATPLPRTQGLGGLGSHLKKVQTLKMPRTCAVLGNLRANLASNVVPAEAYSLLQIGGLTAEEVNGLFSIAEVMTAAPGDVLSAHDAITKSAYEDKVLLILQGNAEILLAGNAGRMLGPGDFASESEFLQLEVTEQLLNLKVDPVEEFFNAADKDKSGVLDASEVQLALKDAGIDITAEQAGKLVAAVDINSDGKVSLEELKAWTDALQQRMMVRDLFLRTDLDGSGAVDASEVQQALNSYLNADFSELQARHST